MKRIIGVIIFCVIVIGGLQIVEAYKENQMSESAKDLTAFFEDEGHVITVLMPDNYYYGNSKYNDLQTIANTILMKEFDYNDKVRVEIIDLDVETREELLKKKNLLLSSKSGPTLIMVDLAEDSLDELIDYGIAVDIEDKLENYKHVYEFIKDGYYVPLGLYSPGTVIDIEVIEAMNEKVPTSEWTKEDFYRLQDKWLETHDVFIEYYEFERVYNYYFSDTELMSVTGKVNLNNDENIDKIMQIRDDFISTSYKIYPGLELTTLQNMLNLNFDEAWGWNRWLQGENAKGHFTQPDYINALHPFSTYHPLLYRPVKLLPTVYNGSNNVSDMGFVLNVNGIHSEYGLKFLDLLISDDYQFYMYEKKLFWGIAPSIYTIENQILNKHPRQVGNVEKKVEPFAFETRAQILKDLESGAIKVNRKSRELLILEENFKRFVVEMSFNDEFFTRDQIVEKLKKFEREVYLKINE